jgi:AMP nucleosidase
MTSKHGAVKDLIACKSGDEALERIINIYTQNCQKVRESYKKIISTNTPNAHDYIYGYYPYAGIKVTPSNMHIDARLSYGVAIDPGVYGITLTRPDLYADYYREQFDLLIKYHKVPIYVGVSDSPIPIPFAGDFFITEAEQERLSVLDTTRVLPNLDRITDQISNNTFRPQSGEPLPLALFTAERVDYSLQRLSHYTGTSPEHFQRFILLTNYQRYIEKFKEYALEELETKGDYNALVQPGDYITQAGSLETEGGIPLHLPQMPAYHLKRPDGEGITLINIGVGPSNAKTITDHLAVLRPHCWLMVGHCAGLRRTQMLGDYVLAHAYVREDRVLDRDLDIAVPVPPIAEIQVALQEAVASVTGQRGREMKTRMRTGTVLTTDNRNWELLSHELFSKFKQTRAIAVDMESATIAANGFRFRVPYGTLLCVSDKPVHGEIKLATVANTFYQQRVQQHLEIGIEAINLLRKNGTEYLHSRKLRGFEEPPFR